MDAVHSDRRKLTILQVVVVVGIVVVVVGLILPALSRVRRTADRMQCTSKLKLIGIGFHSYAEARPTQRSTGETFPTLPAATIPNASLPPDQRLSYAVDLLPYLEADFLFKDIDRSARWDAPANARATQTPLKPFHCPDWVRESKPEPGPLTPYLCVAGLGTNAPSLPGDHRNAGMFGYDRRTELKVPDGMAHTLLILESARDNGPCARGGPSTVRGLDTSDRNYLGIGKQFGGTHFAENRLFWRGGSVGCNALMADGSVRFIKETVSPSILEALATKAGAEMIGEDW